MKTKICYKCKKEKQIMEFRQFKSGKNKGYYHSYCKNCEKPLKKLWLKKNGRRGDRTAQAIRYKKKYPNKVSAHQKLIRALEAKKLIRPLNCSICGTKGMIMGHHKDYDKPLEIVWVCWKCHEMLHSNEEAL